MRKFAGNISAILLSHPARGAWIEIHVFRCKFTAWQSHPARGAWIEMPFSLW
ncbi:hypothetical protein [Oscillospiraceae bacterium]|nr:hypothetical protein [Oscillospiraceae bacterium]